MKPKFIFFDLDHTLWDYEKNARDALVEAYNFFGLSVAFSTEGEFIDTFHEENDRLWDAYNHGRINRGDIRVNRFVEILKDRMSPTWHRYTELSDFFVETCSAKTGLVEGAREVVPVLSQRYAMGILSNGFSDIQTRKISNSGLSGHFDPVVTSESAGYRKPNLEIFHHAERLAGYSGKEILMIGDNLSTDIAGANRAGWQTLWYNPNKTENNHQPAIHHLRELLGLL